MILNFCILLIFQYLDAADSPGLKRQAHRYDTLVFAAVIDVVKCPRLSKIHIRKMCSASLVFYIVWCNHCHNTKFALVRNPPILFTIIFAIMAIALILSCIYVYYRRLHRCAIIVIIIFPYVSCNGKLFGRFISLITFCMIK